MILIRNAHILTMAGETYENGCILLDGTTIAAVGQDLPASDAQVVDAKGLTVLPGFIDAHCHIGMWEDGIGDEGADGNEDTEPITPELRAIDGVNPFDRAFKDAYQSGITTVLTGPGSANVIGGTFVAMKTYGDDISSMIVKEPVAMKIAFGENPKRVYQEQKKAPVTRMASLSLLRSTLIRAQEYLRKRENDDDPPDRDLGLDALSEVLEGRIPLKAHCHRADDILSALRVAEEFGLHMTLDHCTEGHLIPQAIKKSNAGVIIGPLFSTRPKVEMANLSYEAPRILWENGIPFAMSSDHPETPIQYLNLYVALAVREGLPREQALRSITSDAARICGIDEHVGSIEPGKDADLAFFDGDPLELMTKCVCTVVNGQAVYDKNGLFQG